VNSRRPRVAHNNISKMSLAYHHVGEVIAKMRGVLKGLARDPGGLTNDGTRNVRGENPPISPVVGRELKRRKG